MHRPGLGSARHIDRTAPRDANGAYPRQTRFDWYRRDEDGALHSSMPSFETLDAQEIASIVAYLRRLAP